MVENSLKCNERVGANKCVWWKHNQNRNVFVNKKKNLASLFSCMYYNDIQIAKSIHIAT